MRLFLIFVMFMCASVFVSASNGPVCFTSKIKIDDEVVRHKTPYKGLQITSSYSPEFKTLTLWFHSKLENVEVIITKDDEDIADELFDMNTNEILECDLSECGEGEYVFCVRAGDEVYLTTIFL